MSCWWWRTERTREHCVAGAVRAGAATLVLVLENCVAGGGGLVQPCWQRALMQRRALMQWRGGT